MSIVVVPCVAGFDASTERMIAAATSIPAGSVGPNGYIVIDLYMTRGGPNDDILPVLSLGGEAFSLAPMLISDTSFQTRFYIYADDSELAQKLATDMSAVDTPYAKGDYSKLNLSVDMTIDTSLLLRIFILAAGDSLIVEGYSIRLFNPDGI